MTTRPMLSVIYNAENITDKASFPAHSVFLKHGQCDTQLFADIRKQVEPNTPFFVINGACKLPQFWQQRLSAVFKDLEGVEICSALTTQSYALSPITSQQAITASLQQLDQWVYLNQQPGFFYTHSINQDCFLVKDINSLPDLQPTKTVAANNLLVQSAEGQNQQHLTLLDVPVVGDQRPLPVHALAHLHRLLADLNKLPALNNRWPLLDSKPVLLHIAMDWGGGIHHWINDWAEAHPQFHHLIMLSWGELYRHQHGEQLHLKWHNTADHTFRAHHLHVPIAATIDVHHEYKLILDGIVDDYKVGAVVVSSLIGHSFQCLTTGLPTFRVLHDYFPEWPLLNAQLDSKQVKPEDYIDAYKQSCDEPFGCIAANHHQQWVTQLHALLRSHPITLIAPSESVKINLKKLQDGDVYDNTHIIPHAVKPLKVIDYKAQSKPFNILVLGRISPPKGQKLLEACMAQLIADKDIHFIFLGAGNEGKKYLDDARITVVMDYQVNELDTLLGHYSPQLGLITSTASETFSYVLSEMKTAALPVLSTNSGALAERIVNEETGFLCVPDAVEMSEQIKLLKNQPDRLQKVHENLKKLASNTNNDWSGYTALFDARKINTPEYSINSLDVSQKLQHAFQTQQAEATVFSKTQQLKQTNTQLKQVKSDLKASEADRLQKAQWVDSVAAEIQQLKKDFNSGRDEIERLNSNIIETQQRHHQETDELKHTIKDLADLADSRESHIQLLMSSENSLKSELHSLYSSRSWRVTKPLRWLTSGLRNIRNRLKFRYSQARGLPRRVINSLRTRGLSGTAKTISNKLQHQQPKAHKPTNLPNDQLETSELPGFLIATSDKPEVSIIIPVFNHFSHTYHCLKSMAALSEKTTFEVIIIDDCSTDETQELIQKIKGIRYIRQVENGGFIKSCNAGAAAAIGEFILFLNNDTQVYDQWLDALIDTYKQRTDCGLVGSKLIYPDGRLQEAGGIVFSDASGWNYGRLDDPDKAEYNHLRAVSYCSGASIIIKKNLFMQLGMFDLRYCPAYYEDTDLAFEVRQAGLNVYYQPLSVVTHFEGISSGTDLNSGTKKYQKINQKHFLDKWQEALKLQPAPGTDIELSRFQSRLKRVLILDACTPTPDQDSGSVRMLNLMQIFMQLGYQVSFMPENLSHFGKYTEQLQAIGVECLHAPQYKTPVDYLKKHGQRFQTILLSRYYVAQPVMAFIRSYCPSAQLIFDTVDLHYLREMRMAEIENKPQLIKAAEATKIKELSVVKQCDVTLVVSSHEKAVLEKELPTEKVELLSNIHEIYGSSNGFSQRKDILFIGGYQHTPNVDGVLWLCEDIFPAIRKAIPEIKLHIIGSKAPPNVKKLGALDGVEFHGFVENIEPFMQNVRLAVAPLRYGAGVKGKVNMSMSYGQPVIGTSVAVEGMYTTHKEDVMMANTVEEFIEQVIEIYNNESLWNTVSKGGLNNVEQWFSFSAAKKQLEKVLNWQAQE